MNRTPPKKIIQTLRKEVFFGCPIENCGSPYLEWHHFDPPWKEKSHHNVDGMIALCSEHHKKADAGAYTKEQLRKYKRSNKTSKNISGKFDWMRNDLLAIVGGNYFYNVPIILMFKGKKIIWFNRNKENYLLLNIDIKLSSLNERLRIIDNIWVLKGNPISVVSPPSGKLLEVKYENDDFIKINFFEFKDMHRLNKKYPNLDNHDLSFPLTTVEIHYYNLEENLHFEPLLSKIKGVHVQGSFFKNTGTAISIHPPNDRPSPGGITIL